MQIANILMISTLIQIIITSFIINFLVFIPFAKAYCTCACCGNHKVYRKMLYEQIRSGEHECLRFTRALINQLMNIFQITAIFVFTRKREGQVAGNQSDDIDQMLSLMLTVGCTDPNLTHNLRSIQTSLDFVNQWFYVLIIFALFNVFIDFGLPLTFGTTYSTFIRRCTRCLFCKPCRRRLQKGMNNNNSKDDGYNRQEFRPTDGRE